MPGISSWTISDKATQLNWLLSSRSFSFSGSLKISSGLFSTVDRSDVERRSSLSIWLHSSICNTSENAISVSSSLDVESSESEDDSEGNPNEDRRASSFTFARYSIPCFRCCT